MVMNRCCLLLLLLLLLAPKPAEASAHAHVQDQITVVVPVLDAGALRSTMGLELVGELSARWSSERSESRPLDQPLRSDARLLVAPVLRRSRAAILAGRGAVFPRFEHLPYFATAPPFLR